MERTQENKATPQNASTSYWWFLTPEQGAEIFGNKYETLYNSVPPDLESVYRKIIRSIYGDTDAEFQLDEMIIDKAIHKLKSEKLDEDKGLYSNLVINSPTSWKLLLKALMNVW